MRVTPIRVQSKVMLTSARRAHAIRRVIVASQLEYLFGHSGDKLCPGLEAPKPGHLVIVFGHLLFDPIIVKSR